MTNAKLLLADNDKEFLATWKEHIEDEGYSVVAAYTPEEARVILRQGEIDLAVLDVRLLDNADDNDHSGMDLAIQEARALPKIILTDFSNNEIVRALMKPRLDGLPSAVSFVRKEEGVKCLIEAIARALVSDRDKMKKVNAAVSWTDQTLETDYEDARKQVQRNFTSSFVLAIIGAVTILGSVYLAYFRLIEVSWLAPVSGLVTEMLALLFFRRVDLANNRLDRYHDERLANQRFLTLLRLCDMIDSPQQRTDSLVQIIMKAKEEWLKTGSGGS